MSFRCRFSSGSCYNDEEIVSGFQTVLFEPIFSVGEVELGSIDLRREILWLGRVVEKNFIASQA